MNKSLILVMCDVLVLSAMSLSSGGFENGEKRSSGGRDVTGEYAAAVSGLQKAEADAIKARNEAEAAKKGEAIAKKAAEVAKANEELARSEAEKARAGQARAEKGKADADAAAAAAKVAADKADKDRAAAEENAVKARNEAEVAKKGEAIAKNAAEVAKANEERAKNEAEKARAGQARAEKGKSDADAAAAAARKKAAETDIRYGKPARARQERIDRIHETSCRVIVSLGKGKQQQFYSPIINIDGEAYVMSRYEGKELAAIESVKIISRRDSVAYSSRKAYYLKENRGLDIVLFKLCEPGALPMLTLGENSQEALRYWISRASGEAKRAPIVQPGLRQAVNDYKTIEPGDVLVDSGTASIVCLALSKGTFANWFNAKGSFGFDHRITCSDLVFWRAL